jgi:RimJ/RimL family protein N-acetyltransferase
MSELDIRPVSEMESADVRRFFERVPEGDRTFFREDVLAPGVLERWAVSDDSRFVACDGDDIVGYVAVVRGVEWSSHVGELRVVVDPGRRRQGVGTALARHGLISGLELGLKKLVVEVVADQEPTLAMFSGLGFEPEALLRDHVRDAGGELHDLITMAHLVDDTWQTMRGTGIDDLVT